MGALKSRDFIYKGLQFHLNDAKYHNEFTPKYLLMFWNVPISYPRSSRNFSISVDESVTPFPIFVRSWFQLRMSYFGSPPFQDTMLSSFFQPLLDSESTPILLRYSAGILGNSITDESRTVF